MAAKSTWGILGHFSTFVTPVTLLPDQLNPPITFPIIQSQLKYTIPILGLGGGIVGRSDISVAELYRELKSSWLQTVY